ncbi:MAG: hypothetical protein EPO67_11685 [Reyranella sp.]|jgi:hypothetical protein|nr:MAG: hypothetical protein EPO67_11685 [Reyranella sp.]
MNAIKIETLHIAPMLQQEVQPGRKRRVWVFDGRNFREGPAMNSIIYLVGLVVIVMAILSFVGLR